jgi:hypothetical protein
MNRDVQKAAALFLWEKTEQIAVSPCLLDGFEDVTFDGYHGLRGINRPDIYSFTLSSLFTIY